MILADLCIAHRESDCEECDEFDEVAQEITPAQWSWSAKMATYSWEGTSCASEDSAWFQFLTTLMDPRDVDYAL